MFIDNVELVDNEFKVSNIVVDVTFKSLIDNAELADNEFTYPNRVVLVAFKLLEDNYMPKNLRMPELPNVINSSLMSSLPRRVQFKT